MVPAASKIGNTRYGDKANRESGEPGSPAPATSLHNAATGHPAKALNLPGAGCPRVPAPKFTTTRQDVKTVVRQAFQPDYERDTVRLESLTYLIFWRVVANSLSAGGTMLAVTVVAKVAINATRPDPAPGKDPQIPGCRVPGVPANQADLA